MNRSDLQKLARTRLRDAEVLFDKRRYAAAYYLAGYAVECALKARIARNVRRSQFPDKETVLKSYTHDLELLVRIAELGKDLQTQIGNDSTFATYWAVTKDWKETSRYAFRTRIEARDLLIAVGNQQSGVLPWLMKHW